VRPCVAFLSARRPPNWPRDRPIPAAEDVLIPRLDAKEVAAVFSAPFHNFLKQSDEHVMTDAFDYGIDSSGMTAEWYRGLWTDWHESRWRMHNFFVPIAGQTVAWATPGLSSSPAIGSSSLPYRDVPAAKPAFRMAKDNLTRFRVFGMTARILVDAARVAYDEEPEFEHNAHFGDEDMIGRLLRIGRLGAIRRSEDQLTREDMAAAAKL
jgi:hypothetical protein